MNEGEWLCEYEFEGATWCLPGVFASSEDEARAKLMAVGKTGRVLGRTVAHVAVRLPSIDVMVLIFAVGALVGAVLKGVFA